jgi:hypothetical protein
VPHLRKLYDFKTAKKVPAAGRVYANHGLQVNIYRWLVLPHHDIDELELVYMDMSEVKRVPVEVMDIPKLLGWLTPRVQKLKESLDGHGLPPRTGSEGLWQCRGYCSFTDRCWPEGVPSSTPLKRNEEKAPAEIMP